MRPFCIFRCLVRAGWSIFVSSQVWVAPGAYRGGSGAWPALVGSTSPRQIHTLQPIFP